MSGVTAEPEAPRPGRDAIRLPLLVTVAVLVTCAAVAVAGFVGFTMLVAVLAGFGVVVGVGWPVLVAAPSRVGAQLVLTAGALAVVGTVAWTTGSQRLLWVPVVIAVTVLVGFLHQFSRPPVRSRLTEGVAAVAFGVAVVASGAALVPVVMRPDGPGFLAVGLSALAAGAVVELAGRHPRVGALVVLPVTVTGGIVGGLVAGPIGLVPTVGVGLGLLLASFSHTTRRVVAAVPGCRKLSAQVAVGVVSVLICGVLVLALGVLALPTA